MNKTYKIFYDKPCHLQHDEFEYILHDQKIIVALSETDRIMQEIGLIEIEIE